MALICQWQTRRPCCRGECRLHSCTPPLEGAVRQSLQRLHDQGPNNFDSQACLWAANRKIRALVGSLMNIPIACPASPRHCQTVSPGIPRRGVCVRMCVRMYLEWGWGSSRNCPFLPFPVYKLLPAAQHHRVYEGWAPTQDPELLELLGQDAVQRPSSPSSPGVTPLYSANTWKCVLCVRHCWGAAIILGTDEEPETERG